MKELTATPLADYSHEWKVLATADRSDPSNEDRKQCCLRAWSRSLRQIFFSRFLESKSRD
jgi:hypothetical protein